MIVSYHFLNIVLWGGKSGDFGRAEIPKTIT